VPQKKRKFSVMTAVLLLILVLPVMINAQSERWIYRYDSPPSYSGDQAMSVAYGLDGNIYAAGYSEGSNSDFTVASLTSEGVERWIYTYDGTAGSGDLAHKIIYGTDGNLYAVGYTTNVETGNGDFTIISLTSDGTERWVYTWDASGDGGFDEGYDIVYGSDGNVYAAGWSESIYWPDWGRDPWATIISVDTDGNQRWCWSFDTIAPNSQWGRVYSITYGADGNIYATGVQDDGMYLQYNYLTVISHTPGGNLRWVYANSADNSCGRSITYSPDGFIYGGGNLWHGGGVVDNFGVVKLTTTGTEVWVYEYDSGFRDVCYSVACGPDNSIFAAGYCSNGSAQNARDWAVVGLNNDGSQKWIDIYNGVGDGEDVAFSIVCGNNMIYTAGGTHDTLPEYWRFTVMAHDTSGNRVSVYRYMDTNMGPELDIARSVQIGSDNNLYVAGVTSDVDYNDFTVISLPGNVGVEERASFEPTATSEIYRVSSLFGSAIVLKFTEALNQPMSVQLFNCAGALVYAENFTQIPSTLILDCAQIKALPKGLYFLIVSCDKKEIGKSKLIKME
jgi:uncharacterized delta-60 repeat protein